MTTGLRTEASVIHNRLFQFEPTEVVVNRYCEVHSVYGKYIDVAQQKSIDDLLNMNIDLASLEFFWRFKNKKNLLSQKFQILFYLTEVLPDYQNIYLSDRNDHWAVIKLVGWILKSAFRLIKGSFLYSRYL